MIGWVHVYVGSIIGRVLSYEGTGYVIKCVWVDNRLVSE